PRVSCARNRRPRRAAACSWCLAPFIQPSIRAPRPKGPLCDFASPGPAFDIIRSAGRGPMAEPGRGHRARIVVLGGGFAGIYTAMALEKAMDGRDDFEVVLVNKENYFVFQPMLAEVISGSIGMLDVVSPIRRLLPRTDLHVREVESVDLEAKVVMCSPGFRAHPHVVPFDHLVLALGSVTDFRGMRGLPEHAFPFKNLGDALNLRNHGVRA